MNQYELFWIDLDLWSLFIQFGKASFFFIIKWSDVSTIYGSKVVRFFLQNEETLRGNTYFKETTDPLSMTWLKVSLKSTKDIGKCFKSLAITVQEE